MRNQRISKSGCALVKSDACTGLWRTRSAPWTKAERRLAASALAGRSRGELPSHRQPRLTRNDDCDAGIQECCGLYYYSPRASVVAADLKPTIARLQRCTRIRLGLGRGNQH